MRKDNIAEWTGEVPARFHTPFDVGSIPASAIRLVGLNGNIRADEPFLSSNFNKWS